MKSFYDVDAETTYAIELIVLVETYAKFALSHHVVPKKLARCVIDELVPSRHHDDVRLDLATVGQYQAVRCQLFDTVVALLDFDLAVCDQLETALVRIMPLYCGQLTLG